MKVSQSAFQRFMDPISIQWGLSFGPIAGLLCLLFLCSCKGYHSVSSSPVIPDFKKAGELDGHINIKKDYIEYQASLSVSKFMGIYHYGLRGGSFADGAGLMVSQGFGKRKNLRLFSTIGYERGQLSSYVNENPANFTPSYTMKFIYKSSYELFKTNFGVSLTLGKKENLHLSLSYALQDIRFFEFSTYHKSRVSGTSSEGIVTSKGSEIVKIWSPVFSVTYSFGFGMFYYRLIISRDNINRTEFIGHYPIRNASPFGPDILYKDSPLPMLRPTNYVSLAFGMHFDTFVSRLKKH